MTYTEDVVPSARPAYSLHFYFKYLNIEFRKRIKIIDIIDIFNNLAKRLVAELSSTIPSASDKNNQIFIRLVVLRQIV